MGRFEKLVERGMSARDLQDEIRRLIRSYNELRSTYLMVYACCYGPGKPANLDTQLNMDDYYTIYDMLSDAPSDTLDVYLETPGGSGEAAEEIARFTHEKFSKVT